MHITPIKTRIMQPPQDDLYALLYEYLTDVKEKDIVVTFPEV